MLKDALQERTKLWSGLGDEDLDLLAVHEAYQYLSRTFVDDAAKNTVANQQGNNCLHFVSFFSWNHFHENFVKMILLVVFLLSSIQKLLTIYFSRYGDEH